MRPEPPDFEPMFQPGTRYRLPDPAGTVAVVEVHDAGLLHLPTGRVVACDPFWGAQVQRQVAPFTVTVPPGRYPVTLSLARRLLGRPDPVPRLGAAAKLTIRDEPGSEPDRLFEQVWGNDWVNLVVDQVSGLNVVVFHCGWGDGGYATWIGRGVEGEPVCFVADLLVFSDGFGPIAH